MQPDLFLYEITGSVTHRPHGMQKIVRQAHLDAFRLNPIIQNSEEIGDGLIRMISTGSDSKSSVFRHFLAGLFDQVGHIFLQEANDVARKSH